MDHPNNASRLRRQNSLPAKLKRRSSMLRTKLPGMKSNPYVGSFRHSPPTSVLSIDFNDVNQNYYHHLGGGGRRPVPMKSSPYVGWFRHAPPSKLHFHKVDRKHMDLLERCHQLAIILETSLPPLKNKNSKTMPQLSEIINGRLLGGGKEQTALGHYHNNKNLDTHTRLLSSIKSALEESSNESSSATIKILARLGSWFLFPLAYDAESCGYKHHHVCDNDKILSLFPPKNNHGRQEDDSDDDDDDDDTDSDEDDIDDDDDTDGSCSVLSDYHRCLHGHNTPPPIIPNEPLDVSVSDIAQAYYTHQNNNITDELGFDDGNNQSRLDYVITQMDIARMARNASRHLDVDSILNLPTVTYHATTLKNQNQQASATSSGPLEESRDEGFSWMMVPEGDKSTDYPSSSHHTTSSKQSDDQADSCVICLEHFMDGDRLRVLPCDHSFHMGCIDRWLSGSHSHEACFTSGCPTCKKRPSNHYLESSSSDGSVPSWAFCRLGDALAASSRTMSD